MRLLKKYKIYTKTKFVSSLPIRFLKFKRTKWLFLKKLIVRLLRKRRRHKGRRGRSSYKNKLIIKTNKGRWNKLKFAYKNKISNKRLLLIELNLNKRRAKSLKLKQKKTKLGKLQEYFKQLYYLDHLIFINKLSPSVFASKQYIKEKKILVNNKSSFDMKLKKGDFVHIKDHTLSYKKLRRKYTKSKRISTFTETDYYTQSLIVLKDLKNISSVDFSLSVNNSVNLN